LKNWDNRLNAFARILGGQISSEITIPSSLVAAMERAIVSDSAGFLSQGGIPHQDAVSFT